MVALNKIDLPAAEPELYASEIEQVLGIPSEEILKISAKTGEGVSELLDRIVERVPAPSGSSEGPLQALIFDSHYDQYRGVISSIRVMNGQISDGEKVHFIQRGRNAVVEEIGIRSPDPVKVEMLKAGEVGYLVAGIKDVGDAKSGETVTSLRDMASEPLDGYREPKPMVFSGLYPIDGDDYPTPVSYTHLTLPTICSV